MRAVILVGGMGTRLRPLTYETPKQLLPVVGVPLIERSLANLARHGVTGAVLALGYLPEQFVAAYPEGRIAGVAVSYAVEDEPLDTAGAIGFAARQAGIDDTFVVLNGDVVTDLDLSALIAFHRERGAVATIALHPVEDPSRYGVVTTEDDGRVVSFIEKPQGVAPTNLINAGIYVMEPSVLARIAPTGRVSVEREVFPALAAAGELYARADHAYWLDTGTPATYLQANVDILAGKDGPVVGAGQGSWQHPGSHVHPTATLVHAVVDANCVVGPGVWLEQSVLLPGAIIEEGAVVRSSIVGPGAVVGAYAELGPTCVVGAHEQVAAGSWLYGDVRLGGV